jgi:hypothetical protein
MCPAGGWLSLQNLGETSGAGVALRRSLLGSGDGVKDEHHSNKLQMHRDGYVNGRVPVLRLTELIPLN